MAVNVDALLGSRPGKVIAVHLNYPSRAAQRGRTPEQPSYFLKPTTSLAPSGSPVERPAGCELLAFEGEIALVIGRDARRVSPDDGWSHVASVTAANDFGVYDLRWADKGSNLRSKGGDGYTPLGPSLLDAATVDPAALRIRTWVNGDLVQDDTSATLLFDFGRLVADVSQLITLEKGDVILTGTPSGATVVQPGDTVEVEVTAGAASTGRLVSTITQGSIPLAGFGAGPRVDDEQRADAYGTSAARIRSVADRGSRPFDTPPSAATQDEYAADSVDRYSTDESVGGTPPADRVAAEGGVSRSLLTSELIDRINSVGTATLSAQLRKRGLNTVSMDGLRSTKPGKRLVGTARTLRFIPAREDLSDSHGGGYNAHKRIFNTVNPGEVIVMEARGETGTGTVGDLLALRAQVRGAAGIVTDGGVRDLAAVSDMDIVTYHAGGHPAVLGRRHVPWDTDLTITCGGTAVQPGDVIVGDDDGVLVIPPALVEEVVDDAIEQERQETFVAQRIAAGESVEGLYPLKGEWLERYREWLRS